MRKFAFILNTILISIFLWTLFLQPVHASGKFSTTITREYWVQDDMSVRVKEVEKIVNNTSNLYIPSNSEKEFDILAIETGNSENRSALEKSLATAKLTHGSGTSLNYTTKVTNDIASLTAKFPYSLNPGQSISFTFEYTHYGMVEKNGALVDVFLNGFAKDSVFSDSRNTTTYNSNIYIPKDFPTENFIVPAGATKSTSGDYTKYSFTQSQLLDHYVWIQLGKQQFYKFKISQKINSSEDLNTGNQNRYEIVIPRSIDESQVKQTIFYSNISPEPEWVKVDDEGNLLASFKLKSNFDGEIVLEGFASLNMKSDAKVSNMGSLELVDKSKMSDYLGPAEFWQVNDPTIQAQAEKLKGSETDIYKLVSKTYQFVIDKIDYSEVKRFGLNERQGAVETLQGGSAVCMEYSDLFLTLMRAQGVPARAAFGYGYDPKVTPDKQEGHQWVEVYAPALDRWVSVDVTWGENGPALIGGDMNHLYTHIATKSPDDPPGISSVGFGELDLEPASYDISVLDKLSSAESSLMTDENLISKYKYDENVVSESTEFVQAKMEAIYTNIRDGQALSSDQIFIIIASMSILFGGIVVALGLVRKSSIDLPLARNNF